MCFIKTLITDTVENLHLQLTFGCHIHQTSETEVTVFVYANDRNCLKEVYL